MTGKILVVFLVLSAVLAGAGMYYTQVYGFYSEIPESEAAHSITLTSTEGQPLTLPLSDFKGIDANSSPLRYRSCFKIDPSATDLAQIYDAPTPLVGPSWFDCFSAGALTEDLASGAAQAYLAQKDIMPGVDSVIAVYPDGRAFEWRQLNESAEEKRTIE